MRTIHKNQNVQLPTQERISIADVSSNFSKLLDGMQGTVGKAVVVYDADTNCWWPKEVKSPRPLKELWDEEHNK